MKKGRRARKAAAKRADGSSSSQRREAEKGGLKKEEQRGQRAAAPYTWRMFIGIMCLTMYLLNYADRYNISVAIITISEDKGYDKRMQGFIQSAVYLGILPGTLTFGHLAPPREVIRGCGYGY
eukprot:Skav208671  [mRNA]  locus=scaffold775:81127:87436:+ [translate_table: standard]